MGRVTLALLVCAPLLAIIAVLAAGEMLSASWPATVGDAPADLHASTVRIATPDGYVAGWLERICPQPRKQLF